MHQSSFIPKKEQYCMHKNDTFNYQICIKQFTNDRPFETRIDQQSKQSQLNPISPNSKVPQPVPI